MNKSISEIKFNARKKIEYNFPKLIAACALVGVVCATICFLVYIIQILNMNMEELISAALSKNEQAMMKMAEKLSRDPYYLAINVFTILLGSLAVEIALAGYKRMVINVARGQRANIEDIIYPLTHNPDKVIMFGLVIYGLAMVPELLDIVILTGAGNGEGTPSVSVQVFLNLIYFVYMLAVIILNIYLSQAEFLYLDDPEKSFKDMLTESYRLMKGNVFRYILLNLSFIPWYIFAVFTFGSGLIFVMPYHQTALSVFYRNLKGEIA
ncbi:MAG: DUF975 family protein [Lachnospiraceae bacterium]|nr:DUF975 family protein [Lachnospiraceae bacterium]